MDFAEALSHLLQGRCLARAAWYGLKTEIELCHAMKMAEQREIALITKWIFAPTYIWHNVIKVESNALWWQRLLRRKLHSSWIPTVQDLGARDWAIVKSCSARRES